MKKLLNYIEASELPLGTIFEVYNENNKRVGTGYYRFISGDPIVKHYLYSVNENEELDCIRCNFEKFVYCKFKIINNIFYKNGKIVSIEKVK